MKDINLYIKISIIVAILLISFSVFFRFVAFPFIQEGKEKKARALCVTLAEQQATELLKTKAKMDTYGTFDAAAKQNLFLKDDFESSYKNCLRRCGLEK